MIKFFSNSNIFSWIEKLTNFINSIFFIVLLVAISFALILSPPDYLQGDSVRIMYVHVPAAWIGLASFFCIALLSLVNFIFKIKNFNLISKSIAPIGLVFTFLAIITGSLWGQPTWGTFWVWDARITSMLILAIFYIVFILSYKLISDQKNADKISSFVAIIGSINLPIIKYSVDWWNTLHQPASISISGESSISSEMLVPLLFSILGVYLFVFFTGLLSMRAEISSREQNKEWFKKFLSKN